jgi:hypothetical protein
LYRLALLELLGAFRLPDHELLQLLSEGFLNCTFGLILNDILAERYGNPEVIET